MVWTWLCCQTWLPQGCCEDGMMHTFPLMQSLAHSNCSIMVLIYPYILARNNGPGEDLSLARLLMCVLLTFLPSQTQANSLWWCLCNGRIQKTIVVIILGTEFVNRNNCRNLIIVVTFTLKLNFAFLNQEHSESSLTFKLHLSEGYGIEMIPVASWALPE